MAVVEKTIDIIGDEAFCAMIIGRDIPDGMPVDLYDTDVTELRAHALRNFSRLVSVNFPNLTILGKYAFAECPDLKQINMPKVTSIPERAFFSCSSLEEVIFPAATFVGDFSITGKSLRRIELPNVTSSGGSLNFYSNTALVEVIMPKLRYVAPSMFANCTALTHLDLPSGTTISANILNGASSMEVLNFGDKVASINSKAFEGAPEGMVVNLPFAEGVISGAPWGNENLVINYEVPYSGTVPMPED